MLGVEIDEGGAELEALVGIFNGGRVVVVEGVMGCILIVGGMDLLMGSGSWPNGVRTWETVSEYWVRLYGFVSDGGMRGRGFGRWLRAQMASFILSHSKYIGDITLYLLLQIISLCPNNISEVSIILV